MPKGYVSGWFPSLYIQHSPVLSQNANNWYFIHHYFVLRQLISCKMEPLSPGVISTPLLSIFKILQSKIGDILCSYVLLNIWWYHILEKLLLKYLIGILEYSVHICLFYMHIMFLYQVLFLYPHFNEVWRGDTGSSLSIHPSVWERKCICAVFSTIQSGSILYLYILSSKDRRCVTYKYFFYTILKCEYLAFFFLIYHFDFVLFWLWIRYESIVSVIMGWW